MRRLLVVTMTLFGIGLASCHKQEDSIFDESGVAVKLSPLWKTAISDKGELANVVISAPIQYGSTKLLVGGTKGQQRSIISLTAQDGTKNWEWSDLLGLYTNPTYKDPVNINLNTYYQADNLLFFSYATSSYCINLANGSTQWKHKTSLARFDINAGIGETYFSAGGTYGVGDDERLYRGHITDNTTESYVLTPHYNPVVHPASNGFGMIRGIVPFIAQADTLIALLLLDPNADTRLLGYSVGSLYNLSKQQWVYEREILNPDLQTGNIVYPLIYKSKLYYASGRGIHCYDVMTGEPIWSVPFSQGFGFSGFLITDDKLIANCEDTYLYGLNAATGQQLWKEKSSGTSTPLSYLNGVVYFSGGGDGKLHAVDATTGKHLWRLTSPDITINSGAWFYGVCVAVPNKDGSNGRIVATTGLNAYGYEAIR